MRRISVFVLACLCPVWAHAQDVPGDSIESARARIGPVGITPSITVTTLVDSNVFREQDRMRQDVAVTASPATRAWLRMGRGQLSFDGRGDFVYFRRYSGEGSLDGSMTARYHIRANRVTPWIEGRLLRGRQRVGFEIDARARRGESARGGGASVRVLSGTHVAVYGEAADYWYGADERFVGTDLRDALNRRATTIGTSVSQRLTPLTTFVVQGETIRDRFAFSTVRDSDSRRLLAGLDLDAVALISGRVRLGYREFEPRSGASAFRGMVGSVDAAYTLAGRMRFVVAGQRELEYSYDLASPYYLRTGGQLTLITRLSPHWDVQGRIGRQNLNYYDRQASVVRVDRVDTYGGGLGYRIGTSLRFGVNVEQERRLSVTQGRGFDGFRAGAALTYGG